MDDGELAENADHNVMLADVPDRRPSADLREKGLAIDQRAVGISVHEIRGEIDIEPSNVGFIDGPNIVPVEFAQGCSVFFNVGHVPAPALGRQR